MSAPTMNDLLKRIERLEATEEIRKLKQDTAVAADPFMDIDMLVGLYTKDGIMEIPTFDLKLTGQDEIRAFLEVNAFTWMFHCLIPHQIEVADDCQTATAKWYLLEAATVHNGRTKKYDPVWLAGNYLDQMIKQDGVWKLHHTVLTVELLCNYEQGWDHDKRVNVSKDWVGRAQSLMDTLR